MKNFVIICMLVSLSLLSTSVLAQERATSAEKTGTLTVVVSGLKNNDGLVMMALCNSEENYNSDKDGSCDGRSGSIENNQSIIVFEDLPLGKYAIRLFHDANENGELDTNFLGLPKEAYAFSNDAKATFGPPKFDKAMFELKDDIRITIAMSEEE